MEIPSTINNLNRSLPVKPTTRIKIVKKQKASDAGEATSLNTSSRTNKESQQVIQQQHHQQQQLTVVKPEDGHLRMRSVSPGVLLRRAPDIIETIETKTSMSFIMNKSVNLVVEEKREPPPLPPRHSSVRTASVTTTGLSSAISQPQLYQTRIDDLINTANHLIKNSNTCDATTTRQISSSGPTGQTNKTIYKSKFKINSGAFKKVEGGKETDPDTKSIPISVQSRSKSEPKLDLEFDNYASSSPRIDDYRVI